MKREIDNLVEMFSDSFFINLNFINHCNNMACIEDIDRMLDIINIVSPFKTCAIFKVEINSNNKIINYKKIKHRAESKFWENYTTCEFMEIDPIMAQSIEYSKSIKWKDIYASYRNKSNQLEKLITSIEDNNLQNGITFAFNNRDSPNIFVIFSLCMKSLNYDEALIHRLEVLLPHAYRSIQRLSPPENNDDSLLKNLTTREREVMKWVTQGKTSWETGKILSITERTVKFHLNNTYQKLNVTNRTQAITAALSHGLI